MKKLISLVPALTCAFALSLTAGRASAQPLTNDMTCAQAQAVYLDQKRVYTRTRSGSVIPIYGGMPAAGDKKPRCLRGKMRHPIRVTTRDNKSCPIAFTCR